MDEKTKPLNPLQFKVVRIKRMFSSGATFLALLLR